MSNSSHTYLYTVLYSIKEIKCIECEKIIEAGHVKIAQIVDDCDELEWNHTDCFFKECLPRHESEIEGFTKLTSHDQEAIKGQLDSINQTEVTSATENVTKRNVECAVDPNSGMQDYAHVYCKTDEFNRLIYYSVTLSHFDFKQKDQKGEPVNEFHRIQLLQSNDYEYYWVFQSRGPFEAEAECSKITRAFESRADAIEKFEFVYRSETGNNFGAICFAKLPQIVYNLDLPPLAPPIQLLMQMILDAKPGSRKLAHDLVNLSALYKFLNSDIQSIDEKDQDLDQIRKIVENTHSPKHDEYTLSVLQVYQVKRHDDESLFRKYEHLKNRQLLWHGTRMSNFLEILLYGLKFGPVGSNYRGVDSGKGIYFADVVSKSANYCGASETGDIRLMLLCEVALGKSRKINVNTYLPVNGIPNTTHQSVKGCGSILPTQSSTIDGVEIASGPLRNTFFNRLLHNEYVVYDPAQVKLKYIVKVKFNYSANPRSF